MRLPLSIVSYGPLVRTWCGLEYPGHPEGCTNYLEKDWCPEQASEFPVNFDTSHYQLIRGHNDEMFLLRLKKGQVPTMWLFIEEFDLKAFVKGLRKKHDHLSDAQARIPYLWHTKVYNRVYARCQKFRWTIGQPTDLLKRPEANGVNLFATCRANGGPQLEKNPRDTVYMMAMVGITRIE